MEAVAVEIVEVGPQVVANCPFVRVAEVAARTGLSEREIWRRGRSAGGFPRPRKLSTRLTVWVAAEVDAWVAGVIAAA